MYWQQRAKSFWLTEGDANTKYFHAYASTRKRLNRVSQLKKDDGEVVVNHEEMCRVVKEYYNKLYDSERRDGDMGVESGSEIITEEQNNELVAEFTFEEFTTAVKQMHPDKSPGPDGLNPAFFQHFWHVFSKEVYHCCKRWLHDLSFPA